MAIPLTRWGGVLRDTAFATSKIADSEAFLRNSGISTELDEPEPESSGAEEHLKDPGEPNAASFDSDNREIESFFRQKNNVFF